MTVSVRSHRQAEMLEGVSNREGAWRRVSEQPVQTKRGRPRGLSGVLSCSSAEETLAHARYQVACFYVLRIRLYQQRHPHMRAHRQRLCYPFKQKPARPPRVVGGEAAGGHEGL